MTLSNKEAIHKSFEIQAKNFESKSMNFSKKEYLDYTVSSLELSSKDSVLEVASGTCICGRYISPLVEVVACIDTTKAMLDIGKKEAQKNGLNNMVFIESEAERLPFLDDSYDIVISRLAFHHFTNIQKPFEEMVRVLKPGGKLVIIDMESTEESLRKIEDEIETMRDPSHVKNLSEAEMINLFKENSISIEKQEKTRISVSLDAWLELTKTPINTRKDIIDYMREEISGGKETGFYPYIKENEINFEQRWLMVIGKKLL